FPYDTPTPRQLDVAPRSPFDSEVRHHGPADLPTSNSSALRRAQRHDPPRAPRRRLASFQRSRAVARHPHHDGLEIPATLLGSRTRRSSAARRPHVRISTAVPPPSIRGESRGGGRTSSGSDRLLRRLLPFPV